MRYPSDGVSGLLYYSAQGLWLAVGAGRSIISTRAGQPAIATAATGVASTPMTYHYSEAHTAGLLELQILIPVGLFPICTHTPN